MIVFGNEDDQPLAVRRLRQLPGHPECVRNGGEMLREIVQVDVEFFRIKLDPHQEQARFLIAMFIGMKNVAVVPVNEVSNGSDFALAVGTGDEQDGGILHWESCSRFASKKDVARNVSTTSFAQRIRRGVAC